MARSFAGAGVALVTPFTRGGELDEPALRRLVRRQVEGGIDVLVPCGSTGESATLTEKEQGRVIEITMEEAGGKVPVLAGAGGNDTHHVIEKVRAVCALGVQGILSVAPYYNKPTQEGYYLHFTSVADASTVPVVFYNIPGRTGSNMEAKTQLRLANHPNITGVKEASGNMGQIMRVVRERPEGFEVLSGDDELTLAFMALGAEGVISVAANEVPRPMRELVAAARQGDFRQARVLHNRLLPLMNANVIETNPIPVKAALALMGLCEESYRLPLCPPSEATREALRAVLRDLELVR